MPLASLSAAEVLSAPRKWPKGSGPGLFKARPRPGAPPPAPVPVPTGLEAGAARSRRPERRGGRAGPAGGPSRVTQARRPGCGPARCARPHVCGLGRPGPSIPALRSRLPGRQPAPEGMPAGAGAEPPDSGDACSLHPVKQGRTGRPQRGLSSRASPHPRQQRPQPPPGPAGGTQ